MSEKGAREVCRAARPKTERGIKRSGRLGTTTKTPLMSQKKKTPSVNGEGRLTGEATKKGPGRARNRDEILSNDFDRAQTAPKGKITTEGEPGIESKSIRMGLYAVLAGSAAEF